MRRRLRKNQRAIRPARTAAMANTRPTISPVLGFQPPDSGLPLPVLDAVANGFPAVEVGLVERNVNVEAGLGWIIASLFDACVDAVSSLEAVADVACADVE